MAPAVQERGSDMAKTKIQEYDSTAGNNSDIDGIDIAENCAAANMNNALRELMAHIKAALSGSDDSIITGTSGTADNLLKWNADGDAVDSGFAVLDEDDFASDSATGVPTQQSVKAWVEDKATGADAGFVSGTAGTENYLAKWNADGDLVDHGVAPTAGRILYGNGTNWVALDIGTEGQVLKVNSGATAPEWTTDASFDSGTETSVANVDISIPSGAKRVTIEVAEFVPASDGENLQIRCGNGGVDTGASDYSSFNVILSSGASGSDTTAAAILAAWGGSGADTGETTSTVIDVLSPRDASRRTYFHCRSLGLTTAGALEGGISGGRRNTAQDDDTIRLFASNGNIATITYVARAFY
jgi:hypothetical protein